MKVEKQLGNGIGKWLLFADDLEADEMDMQDQS